MMVLLFSVLFFIVAISFLSAFPRPYSMKKSRIESFVKDTLAEWQAKYEAGEGLKVGRIDVHFDARPDCFVKKEGAVVAPTGINLKKGQKILEIAAYPPVLRELRVDGIRCLAWPYPGKCRDNFNYVALCLVKQPSAANMTFPEKATHKQLKPSFAADALAGAAELENQNLHECAVFVDWSRSLAGDGPYTDQFRRIVQKIAAGVILEEDQREKLDDIDDICAAIRHNRFSVHWAQVAAVMACRENGIPCFGFSGATPEKNRIIGMFSDQTGWIYFDFARPDKGFFSDPPVLLTQAPLFTDFDASISGFWGAAAAAYGESEYWGGASPLSYTNWGKPRKEKMPDFTLARTYAFDRLEGGGK